jgi:rod shape-determining protein MreC
MVEATLRNRKPLGVFITSLLLLLILMSYQVRDAATGRTVLGNIMFEVFSPIQSAVMWAVRGIGGTVGNYFTLVNTNKENEVLRRQVESLQIRISTNAQLSQENERLRGILALKSRLSYDMVVGEVVGRDARSVSSTLTINRGQKEGVALDMALVTPAGVVGKTIQVGPLTSRAQLITDSASSIGVMLERTQIAGILAGTGGQQCVLRYLPLISDVKVGDNVVTSGQDGIFPQGLPVGRVSHMLNESDLYKSAEVTPYQEFSSVREVVFLLHLSTINPVLGK